MEKKDVLKQNSYYELLDQNVIAAHNQISLDASYALDLGILNESEKSIVKIYAQKTIREFKNMQKSNLNKHDENFYNLSFFKRIFCNTTKEQQEALNKLYSSEAISLIVNKYIMKFGKFSRVMAFGYSDKVEVRERVTVDSQQAVATMEIYLINEQNTKIIEFGAPLDKREYAILSEEHDPYHSLCDLRDDTIKFLKKVDKKKKGYKFL